MYPLNVQFNGQCNKLQKLCVYSWNNLRHLISSSQKRAREFKRQALKNFTVKVCMKKKRQYY